MGTGGSIPGVNWQGREADHSPPSSAEVKKMWISTATHGVVLNYLSTGTTAASTPEQLRPATCSAEPGASRWSQVQVLGRDGQK
jgi:hypothetical protein